MSDIDFDSIWNRRVKFTPLPEERHIPERCPFAERYYSWAEPIMRNALTYATHVSINQALVQITKKYREWRNVVPKAHKNRIGEQGHICIFHVWDECCRALEAAELSLTPPQLYLPEPQKKSRRKELPANDIPPVSILGELEG